MKTPSGKTYAKADKMYTSVTGIALRTTRHSDRNSILTLWTAELGRISVSVPADKGRRASRIRALTMPLATICAEVDLRPGRDIYNIRELRPASIAPCISADPAKSMTAIFLADFLETSLRDHQPDPVMTAFITDSITLLDRLPDKIALNFHIFFLLRMTRFIGIEPDWTESGGIFDLREGVFRLTPPLHDDFLDEASTAALRTLSRMNPRNLGRFRLTRSQRASILNRILLYYTLHHRPVLSLPSLAILQGW